MILVEKTCKYIIYILFLLSQINNLCNYFKIFKWSSKDYNYEDKRKFHIKLVKNSRNTISTLSKVYFTTSGLCGSYISKIKIFEEGPHLACTTHY